MKGKTLLLGETAVVLHRIRLQWQLFQVEGHPERGGYLCLPAFALPFLTFWCHLCVLQSAIRHVRSPGGKKNLAEEMDGSPQLET